MRQFSKLVILRLFLKRFDFLQCIWKRSEYRENIVIRSVSCGTHYFHSWFIKLKSYLLQKIACLTNLGEQKKTNPPTTKKYKKHLSFFTDLLENVRFARLEVNFGHATALFVFLSTEATLEQNCPKLKITKNINSGI